MEKTSLKENTLFEPLYTGGKVVLAFNGDFLVCACTDEVYVIEVETGKVLKKLEGDTSVITTLALHPQGTQVITCTRNLLVRSWDINPPMDHTQPPTCKRTWKGHTGPIVDCDYHPGGTLVATVSTDHTVKVWSTDGGYCTHNFTGHTGVVNLVRFFPSPRSRLLFSASDQCEIRMWNLDAPGESVVLLNHMSLITAFAFNMEHNTLYSVGTDKVLDVWDITTQQLRATLITHEEERSMVVLSKDADAVLPEQARFLIRQLQGTGRQCDLIALGGASGELRVWCVDPVRGSGTCVWNAGSTRGKAVGKAVKYEEQIEVLSWCERANLLLCASSTQNLYFFNFSTRGRRKREFAGFMDSVLDIKFLDENCSRIVAATNSFDLTVLEIATRNTTFLPGHTDTVLCLDVSRDGEWILSGSRDHTIRLWRAKKLKCLAEGKGHTDPVSGVAFGKKNKALFVSVSQDRTIKTWSYNENKRGTELTVKQTVRGHDQDINSVDQSPNDKLIATASQDKTIRLWNASDLSRVGVLTGHRRGVWHVRFSSVEQILVSASADNTIRLWNIGDQTCIKTLEGHSVSVLRVEFITNGTQLISTGGDGVMKMWTIKTGECVLTKEAHSDKAWSLCVGNEDIFAPVGHPLLVATGGADSTIKIWEDCSEQVEATRRKEEEEKIVVEQRLSNSLAIGDYLNALVYALSLSHKGRALEVLDAMLVLQKEDADGGFAAGQSTLIDVVKRLTPPQLAKCILYIRDWNTIGKYSPIAQQFMHAILRVYPLRTLIEMSPKTINLPQVLQGMIPYTDKHFTRIDRLIQSSYIIDFTIKSISNNPNVMDIKD